MQRKKLPIGVDDFSQIRKHDFYYVDKTNMIAELLQNWGEVNLFTRPRRFGKSLNMSMLRYFFEIGADKGLFEGLSIMKETSLCELYMGQFPVISLTLKQVSGDTYEEAKAQLWTVVRYEARRFRYLLESEKLLDDDKEILSQLRRGDGDLGSSLMQLSELLYTHHGKKVILLIDEYDVPLQMAEQNGYYKEMVKLISQMFGYSMKTNPYLEFAVVTGCLRIAKESIFTGFNNPKMHTIADERYDEWFGFTEAEVEDMLDYYGCEEYRDITKEWYDGYLFGRQYVYCPWDVINWCDQLVNTSNHIPQNFWANTSSNNILRRFAEISDEQTRAQMGILMEGGTVWKKLNFELTYDELYHNVENIWSILFMTGYLTQRNQDAEGDFELAIPNREITRLFIGIVNNWFTEKILGDEAGLQEFFSAVDSGNPAMLEECLNYIMEDSISFLDGGKTEEKENFYHGLLLGMLNRRPGWITKSNREAGDGRADVISYPKRGKEAVIFELKYVKEAEHLEKAAQNALKQMEQKRYDVFFSPRKPDRIRHYGIAFCKKQCRVLMN